MDHFNSIDKLSFLIDKITLNLILCSTHITIGTFDVLSKENSILLEQLL